MRRESSTVVALIGNPDGGLLADLARSPNVSVARPDVGGPEAAPADGAALAAGWEPGALAMREAARRRATYVVVAADPLAAVADGWRAMWDVSGPAPGTAPFERAAADALAAWRDKRFELPDYYLVVAPAQDADTGPDLYLGPLHSAASHRVAVAGVVGADLRAATVLDALRSLRHGPWWPPLDELLDAARHFYAGGLVAPG
jgi:hypothetical protein